MTHAREILQAMVAETRRLLGSRDTMYIVDGVKTTIFDQDGQAYEITIKPKKRSE